MLKRSGYDERLRLEVLKSAKVAFKKILENHQSGLKPIYQSRQWMEEKRHQEKMMKKNKWHKKGQFESVVFVPYTPDGKQAR